jgi:acyl-[acyl-carrier-protein] desaturase
MSRPTDWSQHQQEVLQNLTPEVASKLHLLADFESKHWWANEFFRFMEQPDFHRELSQMRQESAALSDELLVVLVGDMVTEEALPNYSSRLAVMFPDHTGTATDAWSVWQRGWSAEEDQHGTALHNYLLLTGRVDMVAITKSIFSLIRNGFPQEPSLYKGVLYPMFQEVATQVSHANVAKLSNKQGVRMCTEICAKIATDEKRHGQFYFEVSRALFQSDPEQAVIEFGELMTQGIAMPAELMHDGDRGAPSLFRDYASVATRLGVYTPQDYADILERLNTGLGVGNLQVAGEAAKAQEALCKLPDRIRKVADRRKPQANKELPFAWIYGRQATDRVMGI